MKTKFKKVGWMIALAFVCLVGIYQINAYAGQGGVSNNSFESGLTCWSPEGSFGGFGLIEPSTVESATDAPDGTQVARVTPGMQIMSSPCGGNVVGDTVEISMWVKTDVLPSTYYPDPSATPILMARLSVYGNNWYAEIFGPVTDTWTRWSKTVDVSGKTGTNMNPVITNFGIWHLGLFWIARGSSDILVDLVEIESRTAPVANAGTDSVTADTITLDGSLSSDSDGTVVSYSWAEDTNGDGVYETALGSGQILTLAAPSGFHDVQLTVTDDDGLSDSDTVLVANADITYYTNQISAFQADLNSIALNVGLLPPATAAAINSAIDVIQGDLSAANTLLGDIAALLNVGSTSQIIAAIQQLQGDLNAANGKITALKADLAVVDGALADIKLLISSPPGQRTDPRTVSYQSQLVDPDSISILGAAMDDIVDMLLAPPGQNIRNQQWKQ